MCHTRLLWEGDAYPLAAAQQILHGRALYRALWFDKPPLLPLAYLLCGALPGWPLRLAGACYALLACWVASVFARWQWSEREGRWAAALLGFSLCFDLPSAAIPVASDLLLLVPHLAAVTLARRRPFWSGALAAAAFWVSPKGALVAAACILWNPAGIAAMMAGFAAASVPVLTWLAATGALSAYWEQVWQWGRLYAASPLEDAPLRNGVLRTLSWTGFHAAIAVAALWALIQSRVERPALPAADAPGDPPPQAQASDHWQTLRWAVWLLLSLAGVAAGMRFFPRYYFLLLAPMVLLAARGLALMGGAQRIAVCCLLMIPLVRFAPSYAAAARNADWRDTAMDRDSRAACTLVRSMEQPGDTLFVWGYRPEDYVYSALPAATIYLDSQPLTGVPADRHLTQSAPVETRAPGERRTALAQAAPTFILDGLAAYNPRLAIGEYPDLRAWLGNYREVGRTGGTVIYHRKTGTEPADAEEARSGRPPRRPVDAPER